MTTYVPANEEERVAWAGLSKVALIVLVSRLPGHSVVISKKEFEAIKVAGKGVTCSIQTLDEDHFVITVKESDGNRRDGVIYSG